MSSCNPPKSIEGHHILIKWDKTQTEGFDSNSCSDVTLAHIHLLIQHKLNGIKPNDLWMVPSKQKEKEEEKSHDRRSNYTRRSTVTLHSRRAVAVFAQKLNITDICNKLCDKSNPQKKRKNKKNSIIKQVDLQQIHNLSLSTFDISESTPSSKPKLTKWILITNLEPTVSAKQLSDHIQCHCLIAIPAQNIYIQRSKLDIPARAYVHCAELKHAQCIMTKLRMSRLNGRPLWISPRAPTDWFHANQFREKYVNGVRVHFLSLLPGLSSRDSKRDHQQRSSVMSRFLLKLCSLYGTVWSIRMRLEGKIRWGFVGGSAVVEMVSQSEANRVFKALRESSYDKLYAERERRVPDKETMNAVRRRREMEYNAGMRPMPLDSVHLIEVPPKVTMLEIHDEIKRRLGRAPAELMMEWTAHNKIADGVAVSVVMNTIDGFHGGTSTDDDALQLVLKGLNEPPINIHGVEINAEISRNYGYRKAVMEKTKVVRISNLGRNVDEQRLLDHLRSRRCAPPSHLYLTQSVQEKTINYISKDDYIPPGYAVVHCNTMEESLEMMRNVHLSTLNGRRLWCQWWREEDTSPHLEWRGKSYTVRLYHLHWTITNEDLYRMCREYLNPSEIGRAKVLMDKEYIYPLGVGYVSTMGEEAAERLFDALNGKMIKHLRIAVQFTNPVRQGKFHHCDGYRTSGIPVTAVDKARLPPWMRTKQITDRTRRARDLYKSGKMNGTKIVMDYGTSGADKLNSGGSSKIVFKRNTGHQTYGPKQDHQTYGPRPYQGFG